MQFCRQEACALPLLVQHLHPNPVKAQAGSPRLPAHVDPEFVPCARVVVVELEFYRIQTPIGGLPEPFESNDLRAVRDLEHDLHLGPVQSSYE